jgi:hypothetical protein
MLLLEVEADIAEEHEEAFNEWYHTHVPRLMTIPGYASGRRYLHCGGEGPKYLALYEILGPAWLSSLLDADPALRHPASSGDWVVWNRELVPRMRHSSINVFEPDAAGIVPLIGGANPVVILKFADAELAAGLAPGLAELQVREPSILSARLLGASDEPAVRWLDTQPRRLMLLEVSAAAEARRLAGGALTTAIETLIGEPARLRACAYKPIAWHVPFRGVMDGD